MTFDIRYRAALDEQLASGFRPCTECGETKSLDQFHWQRGKPKARCKVCVSTYTKQWALRDEVSARRRARTAEMCEMDRWTRLVWQRLHGRLRRVGLDPDKVQAKRVRFREKNAEKLRTKAVAYRAAHIGQARLTEKAWKAANPDRHQAHRQRRNERIRATADGSITTERVRALFAAAKKCPYCGNRLHDESKSLDHVVPLARGGSHSLSNLTVCCLPCNLRKSDGAPRVLL